MVRPLERTSQRQESPDDDAPTDPRMPIVEPEPDDVPQDLPPGFGPNGDGLHPHPATNPALTTLTFRVRPDPWYRTNAAKLAVVVLVLAAAVASIVVLLWPGSTAPPNDSGTTSPAPAPTPSASPTPTQTSAPAPPPPPAPLPPGGPPPPPPPPSANTVTSPPRPTYYNPPRYSPPSQQRPRTDVTRAPMSVSPTVKPSPDRNSSQPGDAPRRRGGWF